MTQELNPTKEQAPLGEIGSLKTGKSPHKNAPDSTDLHGLPSKESMSRETYREGIHEVESFLVYVRRYQEDIDSLSE